MADLFSTLTAAWRAEFSRSRSYIDGAVSQLSDELFFQRLTPDTNSVAIILKHVAGNMRSRWTDFLTTDGEKPDRNRDQEFQITGDTRDRVTAALDSGWRLVFSTLDSLRPDDLTRTVTIRGESLSVPAAIERQIAHYGYHAGQVLLIARILKGDTQWSWQTVRPGGSRGLNREMADRHGEFMPPARPRP